MSKKYVIEIKPEYEDSFKGLMILGAKDSNLFVDTLAVENLEELNSDYINEHYGDLQDTAYQQGLNEAWEAARKIGHASQMQLKEMGFEFNSNEWFYNPSWYVVMNYTAAEAIEKIKAYEEKQKADGEIKVEKTEAEE